MRHYEIGCGTMVYRGKHLTLLMNTAIRTSARCVRRGGASWGKRERSGANWWHIYAGEDWCQAGDCMGNGVTGVRGLDVGQRN